MSEAKPRGRFIWFDLMTTDPAKAVEFYTSVVGWGTTQWEGSAPYTMWTSASVPIGGVMQLPPEAGAPPHWLAYISSSDVDATAQQAESLGGKVLVAPNDVPTVGRFAVLSDPQGAVFIIAKGLAAGPMPQLPVGAPGTIGWRELFASDWEKDFIFYQKLFGWTKAEAHDMGEQGIYQLFAAGDAAIGGMMNRPAAMPQSWWNYYINVDGIDAARTRLEKAGGKVVMGPMEVPGGQWIVQAQDPQGGFFALVALKR